MFGPVPECVNRTVEETIGAALEVHRRLGPGFLESVYVRAMRVEMAARGIAFECEREVHVVYRGVVLTGQRVDLVVRDCVIVEVKAVAAVEPIHIAQVLSYLKTTGLRMGLLINFNHRLLKDGLRRIVL